MKNLIFFVSFLFISLLKAQTCSGNYKVISYDDFGNGDNFTGSALSPGVTTYSFYDSPIIPCSYSPIGIALYTLYDSYYTLTKSPFYNHTFGCKSPFFSSWIDDKDHTGNNGYMLLCNASGYPDIFYEKNYQVCENTNCKFSIWAANVCRSDNGCILPIIKIDVINVLTSQIISTVSSGNSLVSNSNEKLNWIEISTNFKVPIGQNQVKIRISNLQTGNFGNDLVLDDINFSICVPKGDISGLKDICANKENTLTLALQWGSFIDTEYLWQRSLDNINWEDIANSNSTSYTFTSDKSYYYRVVYAEKGNIKNNNCNGISSTFYQKITNTVLPQVTSPVLFCQNSVAKQLSALGTNLKWFDSSMNLLSSAPVPDTSIIGITKYFVSQTVNSCESEKAEIDVEVVAPPIVPLVTSPIKYCKDELASPLTAIGSNLMWYDSSIKPLSSAPIPNTSIIGITKYFVSQTVNSCESKKAEIDVEVVPPPIAPIVTSQIRYCKNEPSIPLSATGTNLKWYDSSMNLLSSAPTPKTTIIGITKYFVSQTINSCESDKAEVDIEIITKLLAPKVTSTLQYCKNEPASPLSAEGINLKWYDSTMNLLSSAPIPDTSTIGTTKYFVSQGNNSCESDKTEVNVEVFSFPFAPIVTSPIQYCKDDTATSLTAGGTNLKWYDNSKNLLASAPVPDTSLIGTQNFYVSQSNNVCESSLSIIKVNVFDKPNPPQLEDQSICDKKQVVLDAGSGYNTYLWSTGENTQSITVKNVGNYSVKVFNSAGCSAFAEVHVNIGENPTINSVFSGEDYLIVNASGGNPPYEYSIDNEVTWQDSNRFSMLKPGKYKVFVRSKDTYCFGVAETVILFIPNFISPNGDGINDILQFEDLNILQYAKISIYDRYGKLLFENDKKNNFRWDGTYLGRVVNSDSYWYEIDLGNGNIRTGWIVVKNRN